VEKTVKKDKRKEMAKSTGKGNPWRKNANFSSGKFHHSRKKEKKCLKGAPISTAAEEGAKDMRGINCTWKKARNFQNGNGFKIVTRIYRRKGRGPTEGNQKKKNHRCRTGRLEHQRTGECQLTGKRNPKVRGSTY